MSRIYRALLLAYPQPFRHRFGQAMLDAFEQELREAHGRGRARSLPALWWRAVSDSLATSLQMRWAAWRGRPGPPLSRRETPSGRWLGYAGSSGSRQPGRGDGGRDSDKMLGRAGRPAFFDTLWRDLKFALRSLQGNPAFTAVVVLSLGLGIGATSTIFSAMSPILVQPLPFANPDRLVAIGQESDEVPDAQWSLRQSNYVEWREHSSTLEQLEASFSNTRWETYPGIDGAERIAVQYATPGYFGLLGVEPILGRNFVAEDVLPGTTALGSAGAVIISYGVWQRRFGGDPDILGQTWGNQVVVGVMPAGFQLWLWTFADAWKPGHRNGDMYALGRLRPGVSLEQARAELNASGRPHEWAGELADGGAGVMVELLQEHQTRLYTGDLYLLMGAAVLLLLIACSDVASLLVGRATNRHREITTRAALGAGRLRLMRQMFTESIVLALLGGALGVLMTAVGIRLFAVLVPTSIYEHVESIRIDGMVLGFTLGLSLLTVVLFGMVPALRASKPDLAVSLKAGGKGSAGESRPLVHNLLVGSQIALTFVLLVGTALMINSVVRLVTVDRGFSPEPLLSARVDLSGWMVVSDGQRYVTEKEENDTRITVLSPEVDVFYREILERFRALPGVDAAEAASISGARRPFNLLPNDLLAGERAPRAEYRQTSPGFFAVMGIPLLKGRSFTQTDTESAPWVAVINETMARLHFPDEDPIGRSLQADPDRPREIVGIVGDSSVSNPGLAQIPAIYTPDTQHLTEFSQRNRAFYHANRHLLLETSLDPASLAADLRRIVADVDSGVAVYNIETMEALLDRTVTQERFWMRALGIFATLALVLATVGIYGVVAYAVAQRTHEIGVRMALGAQRTDVLKMVIRQGMVMTVGGVIVGVLGAVAATRLLSSWLYGVEPTDPATFVTVAVVLVGIALLATYVPARGATRVDPVNAMRSE